tara:strand:+ start:4330 stop:4785 length:456 start_codon:yes stop_codon:yes gene_type:complete
MGGFKEQYAKWILSDCAEPMKEIEFLAQFLPKEERDALINSNRLVSDMKDLKFDDYIHQYNFMFKAIKEMILAVDTIEKTNSKGDYYIIRKNMYYVLKKCVVKFGKIEEELRQKSEIEKQGYTFLKIPSNKLSVAGKTLLQDGEGVSNGNN